MLLPSPLSLFQAFSNPLVSCPNISALITPLISLLTTFLELITLHVSLYIKIQSLTKNYKKKKKLTKIQKGLTVNEFLEENEREWVEPIQEEEELQVGLSLEDERVALESGKKWWEAIVEVKEAVASMVGLKNKQSKEEAKIEAFFFFFYALSIRKKNKNVIYGLSTRGIFTVFCASQAIVISYSINLFLFLTSEWFLLSDVKI